MKNKPRAIRKGIVMLFSFAIVASILTVGTVGVNESGTAAPSNVTISKAAAGAIGYEKDHGDSVKVPSGKACVGANCGPAKSPKKNSVPLPADQKVQVYGCASVNSGGGCTINGVVKRDLNNHTNYCEYSLKRNGVRVASSGGSAVAYMKNNLLGGIWNPDGNAEKMFSYLTGYDIGWAKYPVSWSKIGDFYWSGVVANTSGKTIGGYTFYCHQITRINTVYQESPKVCVPKNDGRPFPYSTGYYVAYKNAAHYDGTVINKTTGKRYTNRDWTTASASCLYVSASTPPPKKKDVVQKCYWNIKHIGRFSTIKGSIKNGGTATSVAPTSPKQNAKKPIMSGANSTKKISNCTEVIRMDAALSLKDGYAYYRLQGSANFQKFQYYIWDTKFTGGRRLLADITSIGTGTEHERVYGTHSCKSSPPYKQYPSHAALPNITFKYSDCYDGSGHGTYGWDCKISAPKINGVSNSIQVMRDGSYLKVNLGGVNISGRGVRDVNGSAGKVSDGNLSYQVNVIKGSSPLNSSTTMNGGKQYFELWNANKTTEAKWGQWLTKPNANKNSFLSYYWSSDNGKSWSMNYKGKLNKVQFAVPFQTSTTSSPGTQWRTESNVDCDGTKTSNKVTVLRSVSSDG